MDAHFRERMAQAVELGEAALADEARGHWRRRLVG
jgi:hypothetical protein